MSHLSLTASDVEVGSSTTSVKRFTTYHYLAQDHNTSLKEGVLLELGSHGGTYPTHTHMFRSMVAHVAVTELGEPEHTWDEFEPFRVRVLAPERTLLEKLATVHDAAMREDTNALLKYGRHFYDIGQLLTTGLVIDALGSTRPSRLSKAPRSALTKSSQSCRKTAIGSSSLQLPSRPVHLNQPNNGAGQVVTYSCSKANRSTSRRRTRILISPLR